MADGRSGEDWSDQEVDLIVVDYFDMLAMELRGDKYVKAQRNVELQRLTGRSRGSIDFKHQNISAVLLKLGEPWILGYKPMANYQNALIAGVERYLDGNPALKRQEANPPGLAEEGAVYIGPAPAVEIAGRSGGNAALELSGAVWNWTGCAMRNWPPPERGGPDGSCREEATLRS